ncbi:MAG: dTDP-4-amino-4,6-dideoxygalactose transaminase [Succinivibrio sp.]|nr:dTDP-4-amino-4,6-dideoxygalactose transaminase [Succinivibrio sp.]
MTNQIPFNKPYFSSSAIHYVEQCLHSGLVSGDRQFTKEVKSFIEKTFSIKECLLTTSCSSALDISCLLLDLKPGDEVILPSFTFVSTANSVVLRGARPVFVDIDNYLNIDISKIEEYITKRTKAIIPVHYAGCSCDMELLQEIAKKYNIPVIEDAAQACDAKYKDKYLGSIGDLGAYSFHETKNLSCGEGGALLVNNEVYKDRAEIIREKGTNRTKFFRGCVDKYTWCDIGSSFLMSDILSSVLLSQLENKDIIRKKREYVFNKYNKAFLDLEKSNKLRRIQIPKYNTPNYHIFYLILNSEKERNLLLDYLHQRQIGAVFHYIPLHLSQMGTRLGYKKGEFSNTESLSSRLIRLPLFAELQDQQIDYIVESVYSFYKELYHG